MMANESILLVLPLRAYNVHGRIFTDDQACNGLLRWLDNFQAVTLACPTIVACEAPADTLPIDSLPTQGRFRFHALPYAYSPGTFARTFLPTMSRLRTLIAESSYLHFAIGGFWGDWGSFSCVLASRMQRPYAVWTDRVESDVIRFQASSRSGLRRLYGQMNALLTQLLERSVIRRAGIGLFHGMDCYNAYSRFSTNPQLVDDVHLGTDAHISDAELSTRLARQSLRHFVYAGRAHRDKGIHDWIAVFATLAQKRQDFRATWFGSGPDLEAARAEVKRRSLDAVIRFEGSIPHNDLLIALKNADAFVFCHKTRESPRCLIEALACGLPLVGYRSDYASQLVAEHHGGLLISPDDVASLAAAVETLFDDSTLHLRSRAAARDGSLFSTEAIFKHRSDLMKRLIPISLEARDS